MIEWVIMISVRKERAEDIEAIHLVNLLAFGQEDEARLVQKIRNSPGFIPELSLVAMRNSQIVGHILFSQIHIETPQRDIEVLSLAPVAVFPEFQNQGIGSILIRAGLEKARQMGRKIVVVIGHPWYYPKFGFLPARQKGLEAPIPVPDEAFMVLELVPDALVGIAGRVKYPPEFDEAM